jgi:DNA helicase-2/ATP-dependent DNA helicase PcrA
MRPEVLFVRGLIAYARDGFADIENLATRERICQAMLLFASSSVDTQGEASGDEPTSFQQRARFTEQAIRDVASQPGLFTHFVDNQVLRNAPKAVRVQMHAAIEVLAQNATDILLQGFVRALEPQRLARRVMVRAADIAQVSAHIQGLIDSAATFDNVESFFRAMNLREVRHQAMRKQDCIWLASIEASKGLEFDHVILPGLNRGEFAVQGDSTDNRNLLYVGMTRAREQLTVLFDPARPSKYLMDAGLIQANAV